MFKNGYFRYVSESKWNLNPFFKPKQKPIFFLLNCVPAAGRRGPRAARHHGLEVVREGGAERRGHRVEPQRRDVETLVEVLPRRLGRVVCRILGTVFISLTTTPFVIMVMG